MELTMNVAQQQHLSQKIIQSTEILQMNSTELEEYIGKLALENPVIECDDMAVLGQERISPDLNRKLEWLASTDQKNKIYYKQEQEDACMEQQWHNQHDSEESLSEYLMSQLISSELSPHDQAIFEYLTLLLDENGYLTDDLPQLAEKLHLSYEELHHYLDHLKTLDPAGVGASSLSECLILQLKRQGSLTPCKEQILRHHLSDIARNRIHAITSACQITTSAACQIIEEIKTLNPKPGSHFSNRENIKYVTPDVLVVRFSQHFQILINDSQYPTFSVSSFYQKMSQTTTDTEAKKYLDSKIAQAEWVQKCIAQRKSTLSKVAHAIVEHQMDFFMFGPLSKKPLKQADLAEELNLHESTISRAMKGKYLQCSWGVYPLNYFLSKSIKTRDPSESKHITPDHAKAMIREIVRTENKEKPYNDRIISEKLAEHGIIISRRTVSKYRDEIGIPDKVGRRQWG
ncbi:MAG: RNA polymerase factor sigma-54 [Eubacterium sp.]|nr:RNA polymerase factor sigma-54 [Eubacterium sp.]